MHEVVHLMEKFITEKWDIQIAHPTLKAQIANLQRERDLEKTQPRKWYLHLAQEFYRNFYTSSGNTKIKDLLYYWESDTAWDKVNRLNRNGTISVITGDLKGPNKLTHLADFLKRKNEMVTVVDVSNAPAYFRSNPQQIEEFIASLTKLPGLDQGHILFTEFSGFNSHGPQNDGHGTGL